MKRRVLLAIGLLVALAGSLAVAGPARASATTRSFSLAPVNVSVVSGAMSSDMTGSDMMGMPGDSIRVPGSGTFDPAAGTISAKGRFAHYNADGSLHCKGTWKATSFDGFVSFGVDENGDEGGVLSLTVTHFCSTMGMTMTGIPMTVTSTLDAPTGSVEGVTMGMFDSPTVGSVVIQPQQ